MLSIHDRRVLLLEAGNTSFGRGRTYAERGAVTKAVWDGTGDRVIGTVRGTRSQPYHVAIRLERDPTGDLRGVEGSCTCPVGFNCKHVVAVLLSAPSRQPPEPPPAGWEQALRGILHRPGAQEAGIGLQVELVAHRPRPGLPSASGPPGLRLRPVVPGSSGAWIRTGISWSNLNYYRSGQRSSTLQAQIGLLRELVALARLNDAYPTYGYRDDQPVWLESIPSPRVWGLLAEAATLGLPVVSSGRAGLPVVTLADAATVTVDATHAGNDLVLRPSIDHAGIPVDLRRAVLVGRPAHGIVWWGDGAEGKDTPLLTMTALDRRVDDALRTLLEAEPVVVPAGDVDRFRAGAFGRLARVVPVRSSDESVTVPRTPTVLALTVRHLAGPVTELRWELGTPGADEREAFAADAVADDERLGPLMAEAVTRCQPVPAMIDTTRTRPALVAAVELTATASLRFVTEVLPALGTVDGVEVTEVGTAPTYREATAGPTVRFAERSGGDQAGSDWFDLSIEVTVDGEEVPFEDVFVALAEGRSRLILPSGTWCSLERPELAQLAELIAEARGLADAPPASIRVNRFQAGLWEDLADAGADTAGAAAWEASVRGLTEASDRVDHPQPAGLLAHLRPYQLTGFNWMAYLRSQRLGGILADDMGLGKTLQGLALVCHDRDQGGTAPWLVVAPTSVVGGWVAEARRFAPALRVAAITETTARRQVPIGVIAADADLVVTSYTLFRLEADDYSDVGWAGLIADEAQFAKNRASQNNRRLARLPVATKIAMTGTPMENNLMELWALLAITAPGLFARSDHFAEQYQRPIERHRNAERLGQLRRRIRPLVLRRTKEQVAADLPPKQEQVLELELNPRQKRLYQTYLQRERQKVLGLLGDLTKNRIAIFRSLTLLRQASLAAVLVDPAAADVPSTKLDALMGMLDDIVADGHRVLVFSQFTRFLAMARKRLDTAGIDHVYLDGRTRDRARKIEGFRSGQAPAFLISLKAGGFGLNLTEADYCILLDPWWNPATEAQAVDRIHRIGQTRKVMVYRMVAKDTIEEKVMALKERKAALFASVIDAGGFESGALTAGDIRSLVE